MKKIIDLSHSSQVRESLRAELMAKYDGKKKIPAGRGRAGHGAGSRKCKLYFSFR